MSEKITKCPMCGKSHGIIPDILHDGVVYECNEERKYYIYNSLIHKADSVEKERWLNCIFNFVENNPFNHKNDTDYYWRFYYDETEKVQDDDSLINVYQLMKQYPYQVIV